MEEETHEEGKRPGRILKKRKPKRKFKGKKENPYYN